MDLMKFLDRAPKPPNAATMAAEKARAQWLERLTDDAIRAWMHIDQSSPEALNGVAVLLSLALMVQLREKGPNTVEERIFRGAINAAKEAAAHGSVISLATARAITAASQHARHVIESGQVVSIQQAALQVHWGSRELGEAV